MNLPTGTVRRLWMSTNYGGAEHVMSSEVSPQRIFVYWAHCKQVMQHAVISQQNSSQFTQHSNFNQRTKEGTNEPTNQHANFMPQSPSWNSNNYTANPKIPSILCNPNVDYRVHNSPPLVPILCLINPVQALPTDWTPILILPSRLSPGLAGGFFLWDLPCTHLSSRKQSSSSQILTLTYILILLWNLFLGLPDDHFSR